MSKKEKDKINNKETNEPTTVETLLTAKASDKLAAEVKEDLKKKDPPKMTVAEILKKQNGGKIEDFVWGLDLASGEDS